MEKLFLQLLNMSMVASVVIVVVLLLRFPLKKAPKSISYALWSVVLFRLLCPFSFESVFSLLPSAKPLPQEILTAPRPVINSGFPLLDQAVNLPAPTLGDSISPMQVLLFIAAIVWIIGVAVLFIYSIISYLLLKRKVNTAILIEGNIYECDAISSPFVLGLFKPKIYLPFGLSVTQKAYILKHEQTHIKRFDTWIKPIAFLALCVHWFNPLCWLAFAVMSKDMELSCDEAVIKAMGSEIKCDYSTSLLSLATKQKMLNGSPLAFGESNVKARIKNVLSYKKPVLWVIIIAVTAVLLVGAGLFFNPKATNKFNIAAVNTTKSAELSPDDFITAIVQSFQIKEGVARFIIPSKPPAGYELSQLAVHVSGTMPMGNDGNMSLHAFEKEEQERKWQLGQEYIERMLDAEVPNGTEVYINVSLMEKDESTSHFAGDSMIFPLRDSHFTPNVTTTASTVTFTNKFNDTLKLSISLPEGFTMKAPAVGDAIENSQQGTVLLYKGDAAVGTIHYNDFELVRGENGDIPYMSVYNSIMMGSGASWDGEYTPINQAKDTCTAVCKPWHRIDVPGVSGAAQENAVDKGILSYDANLLKYVAIYLDDQAVTQAQLLEIAKSVKLSK